MLLNLLRVAIRNFKKDIWYSMLNILGLTIGITFSLFLIFYIKDELNFDRYHAKGDRIFRITSYVKESGKEEMKWAITQNPLAATLKKDYPEVEEAVRLMPNGRNMYQTGTLKLYEDKVFYADSGLFRVFTYPFIEGDPKTALVAPKSMVLTESVAVKYFGKAGSVVGKSLQDNNGNVYKITGVIRDVPLNSHLIFHVLISASTLPKDNPGAWGGFNIYTYVLLKPNTNAAAFEKKLAVMYDKYMASIFAQFKVKIHYGVQSILAIHLYSDLGNEPEQLGSINYIYIFSSIAFFLLLIACINYMNLTTARSARRAKEIGIRKVSGSTQIQLVGQFLVESMLTALIALLLSIGFIALLLPFFNSLSGKSISFWSLWEPGTFLILLAIVLFVGLVGGSYPAFYLSKFNPLRILKGSMSRGSSNANLRRVLVVIQFSVSMVMLICTWIVYGQLIYLRNKDLGFNKEQVLSLPANSNKNISGQIHSFTNEMRKVPQILSVSTAQSVPGGGNNFNLFSVESKNGFVDKGVDVYAVDEHYFKTLGMKIVKGRGFAGLSDTLNNIIVNENMAKYFEWGDRAIGKRVRRPGDTSDFHFTVIGVIKDFNQKSLYNPIVPLILFYSPDNRNIQLKLSGSKDLPATIAAIQKTWTTIFPDLPFSYTFLDQDFDAQYAADQKRGKLFTTFSILTILITCLGLLGLIAFTTEQRQKEISIRKTLGAGLRQIVPLMTGNFVLLVGLSCFIAFPAAWWFMDKWLKSFTYYTELTVLPFLCSALVVLVITLLTVTFHTVRAALANPADSLRTE